MKTFKDVEVVQSNTPFLLALTFILALIAFIFMIPTGSFAQSNSARNPCYNTGTTNCISVGTNTPLPVTLGGSGTGTAVFGPTASGAASVNPPVQIGGTITGAIGDIVAGVAVKSASTAAAATDTSLVMQLNPNSPGIIVLGQTTKSASVPVTIASDQYVDPCQSPNIAKSSVPINITSTATTSLVAVSGATTVYVCGISLTISEVATTPNTILFEYGTGAACTGPVALTGLYGAGGITAGDPIPVSYGGAGMTIFKSAASNGVCALTAIGGSGSFQGVLTYVQQ